MTPENANTSLIILAGGRGSRMHGADKPLIEYRGTPIIERILAGFSDRFAETVISTNSPERYSHLGLRTVKDEFEHFGPLAGILAAMKIVDTHWAMVVAGDMPQVDFRLFEMLRDKFSSVNRESAKLIVPDVDGFLHPLAGLWRVSLASDIEKFLGTGGRAVHVFVSDVGADAMVLEPADDEMKGLLNELLVNINVPDDLAK
ncbi:MAG: molybdenum cofactor guanylyltransferase [Planctomycetes bacterium]|nr:molybdenum cofactor guanylyltransferase [Planctomycetota bacterium]